MDPTLRRRLPRALAVTAVCLLVFGSGAGFAASTEEDGPPDSFQTAAPRVGDRWTYTSDASATTWSWGPAEAWRHPDGTWYAVLPITVRTLFDVGQANVTWRHDVAANTTRAIVAEAQYEASQPMPSPVPVLPGGEVEIRGDHGTETYLDDSLPCSVRTPFQDGPVDLDAPIELPGCGDAPFKPVTVEDVLGFQTLHLRAHDDNGTRDLWLARELPVPVRVAYTPAEGPDGITMDLTGFEAGDAPLDGAADLPATVPLPPLTYTERPPWGMDDAGVDVRFPLSEAWARARDEPTFSGLRDRITEHPELGAYAAQRFTFTDGTVTWILLLTDDVGTSTLTAYRTYRNDALAAVAPFEDRFYFAEDDGPPVALPDRVLQASSLMARWNALHPDEPANDYGFLHACGTSCNSQIHVGTDASTSNGTALVPGGGYEYDSRTHTLHLQGDGTPLWTLRSQGSSTLQSGGLVKEPIPAPNESVEQEEPREVQATGWSLPPPPTAASVAGAALLVGLLYWLWPAIKSGGFVGLFSRLRRDELLEHPNRAALYDAIRAQPGIHHVALVRLLGKGKGVVAHHLRKLEAGGLVTVHRSAGKTCYFVPGSTHHGLMVALPHVSEAGRRVLAFVCAHPGAVGSEVAASLGLAKSTLSYHVARLREAGLLDRDGRALRATDLGAQAARAAA